MDIFRLQWYCVLLNRGVREECAARKKRKARWRWQRRELLRSRQIFRKLDESSAWRPTPASALIPTIRRIPSRRRMPTSPSSSQEIQIGNWLISTLTRASPALPSTSGRTSRGRRFRSFLALKAKDAPHTVRCAGRSLWQRLFFARAMPAAGQRIFSIFGARDSSCFVRRMATISAML